MRLFLTILPFALVACFPPEIKQKEAQPLNRYWISKHFEYYDIDSLFGGGQTMYGSAFLLRLENSGQVASLGADFYWKNDSLYQGGEPGMTVRIGNWLQRNQNLILNQKLVARTIMLTSDRIGQLEVDTITLQGDSLLIRRSDTLIPVKKPSMEIDLLLNNLYNFHKNKAVNSAVLPK